MPRGPDPALLSRASFPSSGGAHPPTFFDGVRLLRGEFRLLPLCFHRLHSNHSSPQAFFGQGGVLRLLLYQRLLPLLLLNIPLDVLQRLGRRREVRLDALGRAHHPLGEPPLIRPRLAQGDGEIGDVVLELLGSFLRDSVSCRRADWVLFWEAMSASVCGAQTARTVSERSYSWHEVSHVTNHTSWHCALAFCSFSFSSCSLRFASSSWSVTVSMFPASSSRAKNKSSRCDSEINGQSR